MLDPLVSVIVWLYFLDWLQLGFSNLGFPKLMLGNRARSHHSLKLILLVAGFGHFHFLQPVDTVIEKAEQFILPFDYLGLRIPRRSYRLSRLLSQRLLRFLVHQRILLRPVALYLKGGRLVLILAQ